MNSCKRTKVFFAALIFLGVIMVVYTGYPTVRAPESVPNSFLKTERYSTLLPNLVPPYPTQNTSELSTIKHRGQRKILLHQDRQDRLSPLNALNESQPGNKGTSKDTKPSTPLPSSHVRYQLGQSLLSPTGITVTQREGYLSHADNANETSSLPRKTTEAQQANTFIPSLPNSEGPSLTALYDGQTIAVVESQSFNITKCTLIEANKQSDAEKQLQNLSTVAKLQHIPMKDMIQLVSLCQKLDQSDVDASWNAWTFLSGIVPGTKWCGPGDIAKNYDDLGPQTDLDRCCRAHDHCPVKLKAFRAGFGLVNFSLFTKSHCDCDGEFYRCLKELNSPVSLMLGNVYFNVLQVPCVEDEEPCMARDGNCGKPATQSPRPRRLRYAKHLVF